MGISDFVCCLVAAADSFHNAGGALAGAVACIVNRNGNTFHIQNVLLGTHSHDHHIAVDGDLFLASDGIADYLKYEKAVDLITKSPEEIIADSGIYDAPPFASYADDKTLIKLQF